MLRHEPAHRKASYISRVWKLKELYSYTAEGVKQNPTLADNDVYVTFEVTEPLLLSPFIFGSGAGKQGFYGIQTMNFQMNMAPNANRAWRCAIMGFEAAGANYRKDASIVSFTDSTLLFQFLTPIPRTCWSRATS